MYGLNPQLPFNFDWPTSPIDGAQGATLVDLWQAQVEWVEKVGIISVPIVLMNIPALSEHPKAAIHEHLKLSLIHI